MRSILDFSAMKNETRTKLSPMNGELGSAKEMIKRAAAHAAGLTGNGYFERPEQNLLVTISEQQKELALAQIGEGDGGELLGKKNSPPKLAAAHSSSALAVNTFAAWMGRTQGLTVNQIDGFSSV